MTIHNPAGVKLTLDEVDAGWRICFLEELKKKMPMDSEFWSTMGRGWQSTPRSRLGVPIFSADEKETTFRTKTPPPVGPDELDVLTKFLGGD